MCEVVNCIQLVEFWFRADLCEHGNEVLGSIRLKISSKLRSSEL